MVQAEFAQGQLDKDDVSIEQICVLSETETEREREREREREKTKYTELLLNIHVRQLMHTHTHTYSVAVYYLAPLPPSTSTTDELLAKQTRFCGLCRQPGQMLKPATHNNSYIHHGRHACTHRHSLSHIATHLFIITLYLLILEDHSLILGLSSSSRRYSMALEKRPKRLSV